MDQNNTLPVGTLEPKKSRVPLMLFVLLLLFIIIGLSVAVYGLYTGVISVNKVSSSSTSTTTSVASTNYVLTLTSNSKPEDGTYTVSLLNSDTGETATIADNAYKASLSPDHKLVAYTAKSAEVTTEIMINADIMIYDISAKTSSVYLASQAWTNGVEWSPTGKYLVLESGTDVARTYTPVLFATEEEKQAMNTTGLKNQYYWTGLDTLVYMTPSAILDGADKIAGSGVLTQINSLNLITGEIKELAVPTNRNEYSFTGELPVNGIIKIKEVIYTGPLQVGQTNNYNLNVTTGTLTKL